MFDCHISTPKKFCNSVAEKRKHTAGYTGGITENKLTAHTPHSRNPLLIPIQNVNGPMAKKSAKTNENQVNNKFYSTAGKMTIDQMEKIQARILMIINEINNK